MPSWVATSAAPRPGSGGSSTGLLLRGDALNAKAQRRGHAKTGTQPRGRGSPTLASAGQPRRSFHYLSSALHDYVVIGGSAAGYVLARRLSEDPGVRVLLLEASPAPEAAAMVPQTHLFERRMTTPERLPAHGPRPALRGHRADYDAWADRHGCAGWSYAEVLPYFKRLETHQRGASRYHGDRGPLRVADVAAPHALTQTFVHAALAAGVSYDSDLNEEVPDGVGLGQFAASGAAAAYLAPVRTRPNLDVAANARVRRIEIEGGRATGVTYTEDGTAWSADATREVILCGGAVASPLLLMRSGIGPAAHLEACGLPVACDLPGVGQNLHGALAVPVCYGAARASLAHDLDADAAPAEAYAFLQTHAQDHAARGDATQGDTTPAGPPDAYLAARPLGLPPGQTHAEQSPALLLDTVLACPASTGALRLRPGAPEAAPLLDPRLGGARRDLPALVAAIRQARAILGPTVLRELLPGPGKATDAALRSHVRLHAAPLGRLAGTCAMGASGRLPEAVVDPALRVYGIEGLRVADASVMPRRPRGRLLLPTLMVAEKAADLAGGYAPLPAQRTEKRNARLVRSEHRPTPAGPATTPAAARPRPS